MVSLKDHMAQFKDVYLSEDHSHMSVNDTCGSNSKQAFLKVCRGCWKVYPIENDQNKILCSNKLYLCAHKSKNPDVKIHYKGFRAHVQKAGIILEWATPIFRVRILFFLSSAGQWKNKHKYNKSNENVNEDVNDDNWIYNSHLMGLRMGPIHFVRKLLMFC